jgi:DNA-binding transcriptional MocR family regulator
LRARRRDGVFYLSTFSKTFAPGLRVGWILAPHAVRDKLVMTSEANILCPSNFAQSIITTYLSTMPWREQIKTYNRSTVSAATPCSARSPTSCPPARRGPVRPEACSSGSRCPTSSTPKALLPRAIAARVAYVPGTGFYADGKGAKTCGLNFSYPTPERIREGVRRLAGVIEEEAALRAMFNGAL